MQELTNTMSELRELVSGLNEGELNAVPFEGSWSAAQVARHLIKANGGMAEVVMGPVAGSRENDDAFINSVKSIMLDFKTQMKSPEWIVPEAKIYDKGKLMLSLDGVIEKLEAASKLDDMNGICTAFELPGMGSFTRAGGLWFIIYHSQRHINQLKKIISTIRN